MCFIDDQIENKIKNLTKSGCNSSPFNSHCGEWTDTKNHQWIEDDIGNTSNHQTNHSNSHFTDALEDFFISKVDIIYNSEEKNDC